MNALLFFIFHLSFSIDALSFLAATSGFIYNASEFIAETEYYDYIIVGGGTTACPLATTLSKNYSVLILERGGTADENPNVLHEDNLFLNLLQADDKNSAAEAFVSEDGVSNARGRILGGSSMINFGFYSRANEDFYEISGIDWDMNVVYESYKWVEATVANRPKSLGNWQLNYRDGLLQSGIVPDNDYTLDHKVGTKISSVIFDEQGWRHGSVEHLRKANPRNLRVLTHATVDRIVFSSSSSATSLDGISATGVIYHDSNGKSYQVGVRRPHGEVILSAGALGSPQLLLLSGVGPNTYLSSQNISTVYDQPFVGEFMCDNPRNGFYIDSPFLEKVQGPRVVGITDDEIYLVPVSGVVPFDTPYRFALFRGSSPPLNVSMVSVFSKFAKPKSFGKLKLGSATDVSVVPIVRFNYFSEPEDLDQCVAGVKKLQNLLKSEAMRNNYMYLNSNGKKFYKFLGPPLPMINEDDNDDEALVNFCVDTVQTFWHYHGGCLVNKVVDSHLKVKGINGLRVMDGSVLTMSPGTNPHATLMMLGRYMGLSIEKERKNKGEELLHSRTNVES